MDEKFGHFAPDETPNEKNPSSTNVLSIRRNSSTLATPTLRNLQTIPSAAGNNSTYSLSPSSSVHKNSGEGSESSNSPSDLKPNAIISKHSFQGDDIEAQNYTAGNVPASQSKTGLICHRETSDPMWPNRRDLKLKKKALKREKASCTCWASMSRKQRSVISTMIILVILGAGLGVGFGISKRVGGGIINTKGTNSLVSP
ncbi:hypothetical protein GcM3_194009 [Golovinomyces cichoracearum]|uniref:Uncharacterized protein n=1 Tax=Golovinomyces cichoracearum TaxID=62708 RepID=A0A420HGT5_9PEZI|nr:hypothetical protein GcM3_194009 [Golovinomyces cichoracearum]